jgi:hypothetical protein
MGGGADEGAADYRAGDLAGLAEQGRKQRLLDTPI